VLPFEEPVFFEEPSGSGAAVADGGGGGAMAQAGNAFASS
jgi:hypothetical protein